MPIVTLPDGSERAFNQSVSVHDVALDIGPGLAKAALAGVVNGKEVDTSFVIDEDSQLSIITERDDAGVEILRHSTAHLLAQAVQQLFPGTQVTIGPTIEDGFYYDFATGHNFTPEDLERIEKRMEELVADDVSVERIVCSREKAVEIFRNMGEHFKVQIIEDLPDSEEISIYKQGEWMDLCRGPHVPSTGKLKAFKLTKVAGAYWRGDANNQMLQRIYGTAWESAEALQQHLHQLEEAAKRDHRRLATELDLLSFPSEIGGGLAVWHPRGAVVRSIMEDYSRRRHIDGGYQFVYTPHLANGRLFETSGHLDYYRDGMYPPMEMDNGTYYMKPMNCPIHCLIYRSRQRSYRELPLRLFELGNVYRYERAGTLHGLLRIRGFTQDDSHIFVTKDQLADEIADLLDFVLSVLRAFGFDDFTFNLSTKDPDKFVGSNEIWEEATEALREALDRHGLKYAVKDGDAAFYGPKIDIDVRDAIGRSWQLSTIQADFQLPERFDLEYVGTDNERHRPIMLHRALFGSIERFFGVLVEHYAGAFPTWLSPIQVRVLPVAQAHEAHAAEVAARLEAAGVRVDVANADVGLGKRIRAAKLDKLPYTLVVGEDDVASGTVGVNRRSDLVPEGDTDVERDVPLLTFIERFRAEVDQAQAAAINA